MTFISVSNANKELSMGLKDVLSPLGYKRVKPGHFAQWSDDTYTAIHFQAYRRAGENAIRPFAQIGFRKPHLIKHEFMGDGAAQAPDLAVDLQLYYGSYKGDNAALIRCSQVHELAQAKKEVTDFLFDCVLPNFKTYADPLRLTKLYVDKVDFSMSDPSILSWNGYLTAAKGLILSRLYAPEYYELLKRRYEPVFASEPLDHKTLDNIARLIDYLDQEQLPELSA